MTIEPKKQTSITLPTPEDTLAFGMNMAEIAVEGEEGNEGVIIFLHGNLGAGKTTLTRGFLRGLGFKEKVKSPTYTLVESYEIADRSVFHFDFYRLKKAAELEFIGLQDYFSPSSICLIEWPEKGFPLLPPPDLDFHFDLVDKSRELRIEAFTARGISILKRLIKINPSSAHDIT